MFGRLGDTMVLGLPGNPVSSMVCALLFLEPLIARMLGRVDHTIPRLTVALGADVDKNDQRQDYLRARLTRDANGGLVATPFSAQDSSMLSGLVRADCLLIRAPFAPPARAGDPAEAIMLTSRLG
jgi:molybdopterin molybdotransferase